MFLKKYALACLGVFASLFLFGCGGGSASVGVAISTTAATVDGGNAISVTATVTNDKGSAGVLATASGTAPTGVSNAPAVGSLSTGTTYNWQISVADSNGNQAQSQTYLKP